MWLKSHQTSVFDNFSTITGSSRLCLDTADYVKFPESPCLFVGQQLLDQLPPASINYSPPLTPKRSQNSSQWAHHTQQTAQAPPIQPCAGSRGDRNSRKINRLVHRVCPETCKQYSLINTKRVSETDERVFIIMGAPLLSRWGSSLAGFLVKSPKLNTPPAISSISMLAIWLI